MTSLTAKANTGSGTDKLAVKVINTDENAAVVFPYLGTAEISDANPMPVSDAGGSLTIDGSVAVTGTVAVTDNSGSLTVDDGGSSLTIDGTVAATQSGTWNVGTVTTVTNVVHVDDNASTLSVDDGGGSLTIDGTVAVSGTVAVTDNSGSLTVDAPVGTPVFVRLSDGSAAITTLPVSLASVPSHAVTNAGTFAVQDSEKVADNAAFTDGTTKVLPAGFIFDEVAGTALTENNAAAARIDSKRAQVHVIEDATTRGQRMSVDSSGRLTSVVVSPSASSATLANVAGSATSVTLIASNSSRKGAVIHNDSTATLYLKYGSTASATSYTYKVPADSHWEMPSSPVYTGIITGIWASAAGNARTTEI